MILIACCVNHTDCSSFLNTASGIDSLSRLVVITCVMLWPTISCCGTLADIGNCFVVNCILTRLQHVEFSVLWLHCHRKCQTLVGKCHFCDADVNCKPSMYVRQPGHCVLACGLRRNPTEFSLRFKFIK